MEGSIFTKESVAKQLKELNRDYEGRLTWASMFGNVDLARQQAIEGAQSVYGSAIGEAYAAAHQNQAAIGMSNLIEGQKQSAFDANQLALEQAYDSYLQNYKSNLGTIEQNAAGNLQLINEQLYKQADFTSRYANAHIDYLYDLWNKRESSDIAGKLFDDKSFAQYMTPILDENGVPSTDKNGNVVNTLINREQLNNLLFDETGENLTPTGRAFFDMIENSELLRDEYSFGSYLSETDKELYDWAVSGNPYNYTEGMTNAATFKTLVGQESTDNLFTNIESFFGMTPETLNARLSEFESKSEELFEKLRRDDVFDKMKDSASAVSEFSTLISDLLNDFGLMDEFEVEMEKYGAESVEEYLNDIVTNYTEKRSAYESAKDLGSTINNWLVEWQEFNTGLRPAGVFGDISTKAYEKDKAAEEDYEQYNNEVYSIFGNLVADIADYAKNKHQTNLLNFTEREKLTGGEIAAYDDAISIHSQYHNYMLANNETASFLSSGTLGKASNARDKNNDNFTIKTKGGSYQLEVGNKTMDPKISSQLADKVSKSMGRSIQTGDVFYYKDELWVVTEKGNIRNVKRRFGSAYYDQLLELFKYQF